MSNINTESIEKVFNNNFNPLEDKINELHKAITTKELSKYTFLDEPSEILHQGIGETILYDGKEVGGIFKSGISKEGDVFIFNIETFKGHGRNVIRKIFEDKKVKTIYGEATDESIGFWKKMGAVFGNYIEAAYTTEFTITRENFERFNPLENKIDIIKEKFIFGAECDIPDPNLKIKLQNAEIQTDKILQTYDKLSKNELSLEEKYRFATYLTNIYKKADRIGNIGNTFNVNKEKINDTIKLIQSSDIHDKVIGIDNFIALSHTSSTLLPDLLVIVNGVNYKYKIGYCITDEDIDKLFEWRILVDKKIVDKLNEIRERKGLSRFKYEDM